MKRRKAGGPIRDTYIRPDTNPRPTRPEVWFLLDGEPPVARSKGWGDMYWARRR